MSLNESLSILDNCLHKLKCVPGDIGKKVKEKIVFVTEKNRGLEILRNINSFMNRETSCISSEVSVKNAFNFKFCPITSVDVERSFLYFKDILNDKRLRLTEENIEKIVTINLFNKSA